MRACSIVACALAMGLLSVPTAKAQEEMQGVPDPARCAGLTGPDLTRCLGIEASKATDDDDTREKILQIAAAAGVVLVLFSLFTGDDDEDSTSFAPGERQARPRVEFAPIYDPDANMLMARGRIRF